MFGIKKDKPTASEGEQATTEAVVESEVAPVTESPEARETPAPPSLSDDERAVRLRDLQDLVDMVRPIIQQDGGDLLLVSADVEAGVVELQLQGACSSCAISASTLQAGVERILKDRLPWVNEVLGGVDEDIDWEESAAMGRGAYVPKW